MLDATIAKINEFVPDKWRLVMSHKGFKRYFFNTGWMFFGQMFSLLTSFFIGAWLARYLGPERYGTINYAVAFAGMFAFIVDLGVGGVLTRELVKFPEKRDELMGTSLRLKIIGGFLAFTLVSIATALIKASLFTKILIIIFSFEFITQILNVVSAYFQANVKSKNIVKVQLTASVITSILKIFFILSGIGLIWLAIIMALNNVWQTIGYLIIYHEAGLDLKNWKYDSKLAKALFSDSWLLMLSTASYVLFLKVDQVIIGSLMGEKEVGFYAVAVRFVEIWYFIPNIICTSLFPAIINAKKVSEESYKNRLQILYYLMIVLAFVIGLFMTILSHWLIVTIFGSAYLASISVLRIYIWSSVGFFWGVAIVQYLMVENMLRTIFVTYLASTSVNIALNFILIPRIGLNGAAYATLISYFLIPVMVISGGKFWEKVR